MLACRAGEDGTVFRQVPNFDNSVFIYADKLVASLWAEVAIIDATSVGIGVQQEGEVVGENPVKLAADSARHQFLAILGRTQGHYSAIELGLMRHVPFAVGDIESLELAISASDVNRIPL